MHAANGFLLLLLLLVSLLLLQLLGLLLLQLLGLLLLLLLLQQHLLPWCSSLQRAQTPR